MSDECLELQNIEYQTMLLKGDAKVKTSKTDSSNIDDFLEREKLVNENKPWSKLGKNQKIHKLTEYITQYKKKHNCTIAELETLKTYLIRCLERKKLQRVKDVVYDVKTGKIKSIPGLIFDKARRKFTLKRLIKSIPGLIFDKARRKFTLKRLDKNKSSLRSLAPVKNKSKNKTKSKTKRKSNKNRK
jgi:hypothetical protein